MAAWDSSGGVRREVLSYAQDRIVTDPGRPLLDGQCTPRPCCRRGYRRCPCRDVDRIRESTGADTRTYPRAGREHARARAARFSGGEGLQRDVVDERRTNAVRWRG